MTIRHWFYSWIICLCCWFTPAHAAELFTSTSNSPLPAADAYQFSASRQGDVITAHWTMAPGYFLYKDRFCFQVQNQRLHNVKLPAAIPRQDELLGNFEVYANQLNLQIPIQQADSNKPIHLLVCYQGCTENHFCYPPMMQEVTLPPGQISPIAGTPVTHTTANSLSNEQDTLATKLATQHLWLNLLTFFGIGLLLSLTPCVLPMLPILTGLIVGHQQMNSGKAFGISLSYVIAMAITYAIIGLIAGLAGNSIQAALQTPWAIGGLSIVFVALALSLFGFYDIRLPASLQQRLTQVSNHQRSGSYLGAMAMGCLATLILSPCVTPALIGTITYIAQTGNSLTGALILFVMALGMGTPLILVGTFGGHFLPRAGNWTIVIKNLFGVLMLAAAILLLQRLLPGRITLALWGVLLLISSVYLGILQSAVTGWAKFWKGCGLVLALWGALLLIGAAQGHSNPLQPLTPWGSPQAANSLPFIIVNTPAELDAALTQAQAQHQPVMLDFYADWCIACKEMDHTTFQNPAVISALKPWVLLRINMTTNTPAIATIKQRYNIIAPPALIFINAQGQEIANSRLVGAVNPTAFLTHLQQVQLGNINIT
jgi:thiol:disulfide interchange protein DsbD